MATTRQPILSVEDLHVHFGPPDRPVRAVDGVTFDLGAGEIVALVGESGCGKSVTALSLARLLSSPPARYPSGRVLYGGRDVLGMSESALHGIRGREIAYVFQEPAQSLNPVLRVGDQIAESLPRAGAASAVHDLMARVGLPDPPACARAYPHQLSGGMQQRVMIAMALASRPKVLVADEPTTALDVTVQAQILDLLVSLQRREGLSVLLITHNLGIVAGVADRVNVMYAGDIVESGPVRELLSAPRHPYTRALLDAVPKLGGANARLKGIDGAVPNPADLPSGCRFHPRCPLAADICRSADPGPDSVTGAHRVRCHFWRTVEARA